jgi:hypothetical protein
MTQNPPGFDPISVDEYEPQLLSTKELLDRYWPYAKPLLERVVKEAMHGELGIEDIYKKVAAGEFFVFVFKCDKGIIPSVKLAIVLEVIKYPQMAAMNVVALGGEQLFVFHKRFWAMLTGWAYMNGIKVFECSVAPAMQRVIERFGFKKTYARMRYDLLEGNHE